jgi:hypothetical protein
VSLLLLSLLLLLLESFMFHDMEVLGPGPKDLIITTLVCPVVMVNVYSRMVGDVTTVHPVHCVWCVIQKSTFWNSA